MRHGYKVEVDGLIYQIISIFDDAGELPTGFQASPTPLDGLPLPLYMDVDGVIRSTPVRGEYEVWDAEARAWRISISSVREAAVKRAKAQRDAQEFGPFTYNGMTFDGDLDAQRRLSGLVSAAKSAIAAGHTFTKDFTLADNSVVQLTAEDFIGIEMAKLWQVDAAFQEYRAKKAAIEAATTLEELEAVIPTT